MIVRYDTIPPLPIIYKIAVNLHVYKSKRYLYCTCTSQDENPHSQRKMLKWWLVDPSESLDFVQLLVPVVKEADILTSYGYSVVCVVSY